MKHLGTIFLLWAAAILQGAPFILGNGDTAEIALPQNPGATEKFIAQDLAEHLALLTDAQVTVCESPATDARIVLQRDEAYAPEEYAYSVTAEKLVFTGRDFSGLTNAVYAFLENECGFRWYTPSGDRRIPAKTTLCLEEKQLRRTPSFKFRKLMTQHYEHPEALKFCLRNRLNLNLPMHIEPGLLDTYYSYDGRDCHNFFGYIPSASTRNNWGYKWDEDIDYFEEHPEYYSMDAAGKRVNTMQLCFSNQELRELLLKRFSLELERHPENNTIAFSAEDFPQCFCYCPECKKLADKYQTVTGPLIDFILEACEYLAENHPGVKLNTIAYRKEQSEKPPVIQGRLPENFSVIFAPIDDDISKTILHPNNRDTLKNLLEWLALTPHVWFWNYPVAYGDQNALFCAMNRYASETKMLADLGVEGGYYGHDVGMYLGTDFYDMLAWIFAKLYFDATENAWSLCREFCQMYYGEAAEGVYGLVKELAEYADSEDLFMPYDAGKYYQRFWTNDKIAEYERKMASWLSNAEGDPGALAHLRALRINLDYMMLANFQNMREKGLIPPEISAQAIGERTRKAIDEAFDSRYPVKDGEIRTWVLRNRPPGRALPRVVFLAEMEFKPLPPEFDAYPRERISQILPNPIWGATQITDEEAAYGKAVVSLDQKPLKEEPSFGFYDMLIKGEACVRTIPKEEIVPDQYKMYKLGTFVVAQSGVYHCGNWNFCMSADELYDTEHNPWVKKDVYFSLKFEGPLYGGKGPKNRILCDRIVHVKTE